MKKIELKGSYYECGLQYGEACKKEIKLFKKLIYFMVSIAHKPGSSAFSPNFLYLLSTLIGLKKEKARYKAKLSHFEKKFEMYFPEMIDVFKGIAEGSGVPYEDILFLNIATDYLLTCSIWGANGSATADGKPLIGMNADEEKASKKFEVMLEMETPDMTITGTTLAGSMLLNHGMNSQGLAYASTLYFLDIDEVLEENVSLIILQKPLYMFSTVQESLTYFEKTPNSNVGLVVAVADADDLIRVEYSHRTKSIEKIDNGSFGNTNIPSNEEIRKLDLMQNLPDKKNLNANHRNVRMKHLLSTYDGKIDMAVMYKIASDHGEGTTKDKSMCQHGKFMTLASFIANPSKREFFIFDGPPCSSNKYSFKV